MGSILRVPTAARVLRHLRWGRHFAPATMLSLLALCTGCLPMVRATDQEVERLIAARQRAALGQTAAANVEVPAKMPKPGRIAYAYGPSPTTAEIPAEFAQTSSQPAMTSLAPSPTSAPTSEPARVFTLTDALAYAQRHQREFQSAKEDLYLATLALTLERHLWTPIFASNLRTVYGNYGEARNFDQAMRFVADLSVAQRLPYGGTFTANAVSTLIRDVKKTITAQEGSTLGLGLNIPFLRGAGHVAQETLIQLERELTYSVRIFERYRRQQMVSVAQAYFSLLAAKQRVIDSQTSYGNFVFDVERARDMERIGRGTPLDTQRAEQAMLSQENALETASEAFRAATDNFKILIGMPVDDLLGLDELEDIETIEQQIGNGVYPLLARPLAVNEESRAVEVALQRRFDLITLTDRIDDARRGVTISRNALLPDLNWNSTLTFDTDPNHYNLGAFSFDRANWRSEVVLALPLERTAERNDLRRKLIDVAQAERACVSQSERIRAEVRAAVHNILLQERSLAIQAKAVDVAERQREFAQIQYDDGKIDNRDKIDAENAWVNARNQFSLAKTDGWGALLQFRLSTETLRIEEDGSQQADYELPAGP
jgi:outer membrane protein TolC